MLNLPDLPAAAPAEARAAVLTRIRAALAVGPTPNLPDAPDQDAPVHPPLPEQDLVLTFADNFRRAGGEFFYVETSAQLGRELRAWLSERLPEAQKFYVWEPEMQALLTEADVPFEATEADFRTQAAVGLTSCAALVARTGSVLFSSGSASGRRLSIYPDQHIVLARPAQMVADIGEALTRGVAGVTPAMLSLTTGPSRTADIEKTLVLGAHGPRRLTMFLVGA